VADERKTILVVDDAPENIRVLTAVLGPRYRVKAATSGEKALQMCAVDPLPDLVLLDVMMPGMDGYEVCRRLKGEGRTAGVPVIFVTGLAEETERERGRSLGAADFLVKPLDPADVLARIASQLREGS
jgi:CheY-like chemotaxis protein